MDSGACAFSIMRNTNFSQYTGGRMDTDGRMAKDTKEIFLVRGSGNRWSFSGNGIKYTIVRKEVAINDDFTVTKLPGSLLRLHHHTSTKQQ